MSRPRPSLIVRVVGRWHQLLAAIVLMVGLGAGQFAVYRVRASIAVLMLVMAPFFALTAGLFLTGRGIVLGRRWAWRAGAVLSGALLVLLLYAVMVAPQPPAQRWAAVAITLLLFGVPVALLALPSTRRAFWDATGR